MSFKYIPFNTLRSMHFRKPLLYYPTITHTIYIYIERLTFKNAVQQARLTEEEERETETKNVSNMVTLGNTL